MRNIFDKKLVAHLLLGLFFLITIYKSSQHKVVDLTVTISWPSNRVRRFKDPRTKFLSRGKVEIQSSRHNTHPPCRIVAVMRTKRRMTAAIIPITGGELAAILRRTRGETWLFLQSPSVVNVCGGRTPRQPGHTASKGHKERVLL